MMTMRLLILLIIVVGVEVVCSPAEASKFRILRSALQLVDTAQQKALSLVRRTVDEMTSG